MHDDRKPRRTRGPRTPSERADDAGATAATLFEKLPPSYFSDGTLKPIAQFLRLTSARSGDWPPQYLSLRDLRRLEKDEREFLEALEKWRSIIDSAPVEKVLSVDALLETGRRTLREMKARIAALTDHV